MSYVSNNTNDRSNVTMIVFNKRTGTIRNEKNLRTNRCVSQCSLIYLVVANEIIASSLSQSSFHEPSPFLPHSTSFQIDEKRKKSTTDARDMCMVEG